MSSLLPYQQDVLRWLENHSGIVLVHTTGSRRSLTAIAIAEQFLETQPEQKIRVFAPVALLEHFQLEMERTGLNNDSQYTFTSLEYILDENKEPQCMPGDLLIIDNAHMLRTRKNADKFLSCAKQSAKVVLMTSTPVVDDTRDILPLLAMVKQTDLLSDAEWSALLQDVGLFKQYVSGVFHFYSVAKTAMNHFPSVDIKEQQVQMDSTLYTDYVKMEENHKVEKKMDSVSFLLDRQKELAQFVDKAKVEFAQEKIRGMSARDKLVILARLQSATVRELYTWLKEKKIKYTYVESDLSTRRLQKHIDAYNEESVNVLFLDLEMPVSVNLLRTREMIVLDVVPSEIVLNRAIDSVAHYRSHDKLTFFNRNVTVYVLYTVKPPNTIWNEIREILKKRAIEKPILSIDLLLKTSVETANQTRKKFIQKLESVQIKFPRRSSSGSRSATRTRTRRE